MTEEIELSHKAPKVKVGDRVKITQYKNIFSKNDIKNWSKKVFINDSENHINDSKN